jgi:hypothetical protein
VVVRESAADPHRSLGMQRLPFLILSLALGGCPAGPRYLIADVHAQRVPVEGALVAADCGKVSKKAMRTDDSGRARLALHGTAPNAGCTVTVAAPSLPTVEVAGAGTCTAPLACPPIVVDLAQPRSDLRPPGLSSVPREPVKAEVAQ